MNPPALTAGLAAAAAAWALSARWGTGANPRLVRTTFDRERIERLRRESMAFLLGGETLGESEWFCRFTPARLVAATAIRLRRLGPNQAWEPLWWLAAVAVEGAVIWIIGGIVWAYTGGSVVQSALIGVGAIPAWALLRWRHLGAGGKKRAGDCRAVMPFAIDGMGLVIKSGADVTDALRMAAGSYAGSVLGGELQEVIDRLDAGEPLADALRAFRTRIDLDEIEELAMTAESTHEMGADIGEALLDLAARIRDRRSLQIETQAGHAQVQLYYPGMLLLLVCLVAVVAPFIAPACDLFTEIKGN